LKGKRKTQCRTLNPANTHAAGQLIEKTLKSLRQQLCEQYGCCQQQQQQQEVGELSGEQAVGELVASETGCLRLLCCLNRTHVTETRKTCAEALFEADPPTLGDQF
jgi:hypothetical protein